GRGGAAAFRSADQERNSRTEIPPIMTMSRVRTARPHLFMVGTGMATNSVALHEISCVPWRSPPVQASAALKGSPSAAELGTSQEMLKSTDSPAPSVPESGDGDTLISGSPDRPHS